jgi:hypothetical protein
MTIFAKHCELLNGLVNSGLEVALIAAVKNYHVIVNARSVVLREPGAGT